MAIAKQPRDSIKESIVRNSEHKEGPVAKSIEEQTAKLPSDLFLWTALGSVATAAALRVAGKDEASTFVGQWVAPILLLGVYNKIVKVGGSDKQTA